MEKQLIKNLKIGDEVETQALVLEANKTKYASPHRAGEQFMKLTLGDVSGTVRGIIWDLNLLSEPLEKGEVVFLKGSVNEYHGPQIVIKEIKKLAPDKVNRRYLQPMSDRDPQEMLQELKKIITEEVENSSLQRLLKKVFSDKNFVQKFAQAPAAKTVHHNYVGGLLEHTLEVVDLSKKIAEMYPDQINQDVLLTGAILHDMGKVEEYDMDSLNFELTDRGKLLGHISIGKEMLDRCIHQLEEFPQELKLELEHVLLTHHGKKEWGSPEIPKTIQAFALYYADLVSARISQFSKLMHSHQSQETFWTEWDRFLERSAFVKKLNDE